MRSREERDRLVDEHRNLVGWMLRRFSRLPFRADLEQAGYLALIAAAARYDAAKGSFSTYAALCIRGGMIRECRKRSIIKVPDWMDGRTWKREFRKIRWTDFRFDREGEWAGPDPHDDVAACEDRLDVQALLAVLDERQRRVVAERLAGATLDAIGQRLGLCRERVRGIVRECVEKLEFYRRRRAA